MKYGEAKKMKRQILARAGDPRLRLRIVPFGYLRPTKGFVGRKGWKLQWSIQRFVQNGSGDWHDLRC